MTFLFVGLGGAAGAIARHAVAAWSIRRLGAALPYGTLGVNLVGSALIGILFAFLMKTGRGGAGDPIRLLLGTGFLGGFTTFSAFSIETVLLAERGRVDLAALYVGLSVLGSLGAAALAFFLARSGFGA